MPHKELEARRAYHREYREKHRNDICAKGKEYRRRPDVKAHKKAYDQQLKVKEWRQAYKRRTDVVERERAGQRERRLRRYGLTCEEFDAMMTCQDFSCSVCKSSDWGPQGPHVDHDHQTGKVRGILCYRCNIATGYLRNDPRVARAIADYLERGAE